MILRPSLDPPGGGSESPASRELLAHARRALADARLGQRVAREAPKAPILVAFSGGADSTALLAALGEIGPPFGLAPVAAHFDHRLDRDSSDRARAAERLADQLQIPFVGGRREGSNPIGRGVEAGARLLRYDFLERQRNALGAVAIAVAHTLDDQIETVLQRLLSGSGIRGLAGIPARRGTIVRPLLGVHREHAAAFVRGLGLLPVEDPTNAGALAQRSFVRNHLLPSLRRSDGDIDAALRSLSRRAEAACSVVVRRVRSATPIVSDGTRRGVARQGLAALPAPLRRFLLAELHRTAGADYPPRAVAVRELERQLDGSSIGVDCGDGWRWQGDRHHLWVQRRAPKTPFFAYTLRVPGEVVIREIAASVRVRREVVKPWMLRGASTRAAFALPLKDGDPVVLRNRRSGDRLTPLGCDYERRLKEILIDHKVPRSERSRLPLLCLEAEGSRIVWVPGVTIDNRFRLRDETTAWTAEITTR